MDFVKKNVAISCGPIPSKLDAVKYITNRFKGGLAFKTAEYLASQGHDVTVVVWEHTHIPLDLTEKYPAIKHVKVKDVCDYYGWFCANANKYDAFVMAAAVANLMPAKPFEGKFPSHLYKVGDEFDIKFTIAPRAIDAIKERNPRACLIGYKLFDEPDDDKLIDIARHTLADSKANIIFANRPTDAARQKIAVTADGSAFKVSFHQHLELIDRAIQQTYFKTEVVPLDSYEANNPRIMAAMDLVRFFEKTFPGYGTIAVPTWSGQFVTTARGHKSNEPVLVRNIDPEHGIVYASGKATLNAPVMSLFVDANRDRYAVHRHFGDPKAQASPAEDTFICEKYIFPGTMEEYQRGLDCISANKSRLAEAHHGYIQSYDYESIDWTEYYNTFPDRYFSIPTKFQEVLDKFRDKDTLEIGGNKNPTGKFTYDPYVQPENDAIDLNKGEIDSRKFDLVFIKNAICYLTPDEIQFFVDHGISFIANAPATMPNISTRENEIAVKVPICDKEHKWHDEIHHYLILEDGRIIRHKFFAYDENFYRSLGLTTTRYGRNSVLVSKNLSVCGL